jgi:hypothetical protein
MESLPLPTPINHTPHDVVIFDRSGSTVTAVFHPQLPCIRLLSDAPVPGAQVDGGAGYSLVSTVQPPYYTGIDTAGRMVGRDIIVSQLVAEWLMQGDHNKALDHIYAPDSGPASVVRNDKGVVVGVKRLIQYK